MHIPDGYLGPETCGFFYAVMIPVWTLASRTVKKTLKARQVPLLAIGAAFSFLSSASWRLPFFITVSIVAALVILIAFRKLRDDQKLAQTSLALIFSGAVGNLIDRVRMGEVIDFLDAHWYRHHWPAFNVADSLICVGVFLLAVDMILEERRVKTGI